MWSECKAIRLTGLTLGNKPSQCGVAKALSNGSSTTCSVPLLLIHVNWWTSIGMSTRSQSLTAWRKPTHSQFGWGWIPSVSCRVRRSLKSSMIHQGLQFPSHFPCCYWFHSSTINVMWKMKQKQTFHRLFDCNTLHWAPHIRHSHFHWLHMSLSHKNRPMTHHWRCIISHPTSSKSKQNPSSSPSSWIDKFPILGLAIPNRNTNRRTKKTQQNKKQASQKRRKPKP